jgi:Uri superfamily endonuclease
MTLARRLLRHASRTSNKPPQPIRAQLLDLFQPIQPPQQKTLRWHVDFLLDELAAELVQMIVIQSSQRLEGTLGQMLLADEGTAVIAPGLGATDIKGNTHILQIPNDDNWWHTLVSQVQTTFA